VIPRDYITEWRGEAPWVQDLQVEQDLIISKALIDIFSDKLLGNALAFRGGTALYKLFIRPAARYSEDIDLVQIEAGPAGDIMEALRVALNPWLGEPRYRQSEGRVTFFYRFHSEDTPPVPLRLKVEINTREHFSVYGIDQVPFTVDSRWFEGECAIPSYQLDELLGTKLRALYQRRKGRDLFDLAVALDDNKASPERIIESFRAYMDHGGHRVSRAQFEQNLAGKLRDRSFAADIGPLLADGFSWDIDKMAGTISNSLITRLPGDPWQGGA
jgi:predicted nucleotidyltransferase component of viral defense system